MIIPHMDFFVHIVAGIQDVNQNSLFNVIRYRESSWGIFWLMFSLHRKGWLKRIKLTEKEYDRKKAKAN